VLIVDDAQWSDRPSLQVLSYLAGRTCDLPLLILVAARVGDPRGANDLLALLAGARSATVLHPQPLTSMGAVRLIRGLVPEASIHVAATAIGPPPAILGSSMSWPARCGPTVRPRSSGRTVSRRW